MPTSAQLHLYSPRSGAWLPSRIAYCLQSLLLQLVCSQTTLTHVCPALQSMLPQLVCACTVSIIGAALDAHVRSAKDRGWGHPVQLPTAGSDDESRAPLQVQRASHD